MNSQFVCVCVCVAIEILTQMFGSLRRYCVNKSTSSEAKIEWRLLRYIRTKYRD